jgi:hypothetical protein
MQYGSAVRLHPRPAHRRRRGRALLDVAKAQELGAADAAAVKLNQTAELRRFKNQGRASMDRQDIGDTRWAAARAGLISVDGSFALDNCRLVRTDRWRSLVWKFTSPACRPSLGAGLGVPRSEGQTFRTRNRPPGSDSPWLSTVNFARQRQRMCRGDCVGHRARQPSEAPTGR